MIVFCRDYAIFSSCFVLPIYRLGEHTLETVKNSTKMALSMKRWEGKVAVVTGASVGIGAIISQKLVDAGLLVAGFARRPELVETLAKALQGKPGQLHAVKVDVSKPDEVVAGFKWVKEHLGPVAILINNAGTTQHTTLYAGDADKWRKVLDTNVLGLCVATREAIASMRASKIDGHIVHMNGLLGHFPIPVPNYNVYAPSKYAVTALTETLRQELNALNSKIKVSSVSPGVVSTDFFINGGHQITEEMRAFRAKIPALKPEEVADAVFYVLSTPPHVQIHELMLRAI